MHRPHTPCFLSSAAHAVLSSAAPPGLDGWRGDRPATWLPAPQVAPVIVRRVPSLRARPKIGTFERSSACCRRAARESSARGRAEGRPFAPSFGYVLRMVPTDVVQALKRSEGGIRGGVAAYARGCELCYQNGNFVAVLVTCNSNRYIHTAAQARVSLVQAVERVLWAMETRALPGHRRGAEFRNR